MFNRFVNFFENTIDGVEFNFVVFGSAKRLICFSFLVLVNQDDDGNGRLQFVVCRVILLIMLRVKALIALIIIITHFDERWIFRKIAFCKIYF